MGEKIFNDDFFKKLNKINLYLNMRLNEGTQGGRKSKAKGVSVEFSDFREYSYGDDFRRIDWNAFGRFNKLFIKVFMEEREGVFNFFIDKSKSMDYGEKKKSKLSLQIVGAISYIVLNNLDRVNITTMSDGNIEIIKGGNGKRLFQRLLLQLEKTEFNGKTSLSDSIRKRKITGKGVSLIVSDFFNNEGTEELEKGLKYLAFKKQEIILLQVLSDEEIEPNYDSEVTLIDSETGSEIKMNITPKVVEEYQKNLREYNEKLENLARKYGGKYLMVKSSQEIEEVILGELSRKRIIY